MPRRPSRCVTAKLRRPEPGRDEIRVDLDVEHQRAVQAADQGSCLFQVGQIAHGQAHRAKSSGEPDEVRIGELRRLRRQPAGPQCVHLGAVRRVVEHHDEHPGTVLARRLSNAEYDNTIRDLTGQDMQVARQFPVDPANTAGFDNSGETLTMSPALLNKYLQGARQIADHVVLKPDGIDLNFGCPAKTVNRHGGGASASPGDVGEAARKKLLAQPGGVLLITPESIEAMFLHRASQLFKLFHDLDYVVIDELHVFPGTERGMHLRSLLARLER